MYRRKLTVLAVIGVLLLFSLPASAQTKTGRILGEVLGADGVPLAGVTVTASSDVVMGGSRTAVTGDSGAYRFAALPPGMYTVTASLEGHQSQTVESSGTTHGISGCLQRRQALLEERFSPSLATLVVGRDALVQKHTGNPNVVAHFAKKRQAVSKPLLRACVATTVVGCQPKFLQAPRGDSRTV